MQSCEAFCSGHCGGGCVGWGCSRTLHRNSQAIEQHGQQHGDTIAGIALPHFLYMLHLCCVHSLHALSPSCTFRLARGWVMSGAPHSRLRNDVCTQRLVISSKQSMQPKSPLVLLQPDSKNCLMLSRLSLESSCHISSFPFCSPNFSLDGWDYVGLLPLRVWGGWLEIQVQQAPTGHKQLSLRQEAWALS